MIYCIIAGLVVAMGSIFIETGGKVDLSVMGAEDQPLNALAAFQETVALGEQCCLQSKQCKCQSSVTAGAFLLQISHYTNEIPNTNVLTLLG